MLGEVIFGGVGSGLYGMLAFVIIAVFVAGLMVGQHSGIPGEKNRDLRNANVCPGCIDPGDLCTFWSRHSALIAPSGKAGIFNSGPQGFSEVLYAFASAGNNNGSAFAGLNANNTFYNILLGSAMLIGRFALIVAILALAGSLVKKKKLPDNEGTLPTHSPLFIGWFTSVIIIVGALSFLPALALGPIVQHLLLGTGVFF